MTFGPCVHFSENTNLTCVLTENEQKRKRPQAAAKKMKKQKVIRFFHTVLDPTVLGHPIYTFVNFVLYNLTEEKERSFLGYLKAYPNVVYVAKTTGKWDFTINIAAKNLKHFDEVMKEIRMKFSKIIKEYETASIIEEYKYDYMVDLI